MRPVFAAFAAFRCALLVLVLALLPAARPAAAADAAELETLWRVMLMPEVIEIMRAEGLAYGLSLDDDMLAGQGGSGWAAEVEAIYDAGRMAAGSKAAFAEALAGSDITDAIAFFSSDLGAHALQLELAARQTMLDPEADEAARIHADEMRDQDDPRVALLTRFAEANDLFEANIAGALNANYAFNRGLAAGGALEEGMDEAAILTEVWSQEPGVREDTIDWVYSFLTLAYQPMSDAELEAYIAYSETPDGKLLNRALFTAFDGMFLDISYALGAGLAKRMVGQEL